MPEMRFTVLRVKQWWEVIFFGKQGDAAENTRSQILPTLFENDLVLKNHVILLALGFRTWVKFIIIDISGPTEILISFPDPILFILVCDYTIILAGRNLIHEKSSLLSANSE